MSVNEIPGRDELPDDYPETVAAERAERERVADAWPCEHCDATGVWEGRECRECQGTGIAHSK